MEDYCDIGPKSSEEEDEEIPKSLRMSLKEPEVDMKRPLSESSHRCRRPHAS